MSSLARDAAPLATGDTSRAPGTPGMAASDVALHTLEVIERAAGVVRAHFAAIPEAGIILGTGLGGLARQIESAVSIDYADIPGFPLSTVESHAGRLLCGTLGGRPVLAMQGRFHR